MGLYLELLVLIIAGFGMLVGLLLGLGKVPLELFGISSYCYSNILLGLLVRCLLELFLFGTALLSFL